MQKGFGRGGYYDDLKHYKKEATKAAKDFDYGDEVIKAIANAKTQEEISILMRKAREKKK